MSPRLAFLSLFAILIAACRPAVTDILPTAEPVQGETDSTEEPTEQEITDSPTTAPTEDTSEEVSPTESSAAVSSSTNPEDCLPTGIQFRVSYWPETDFCQHTIDYLDIFSGGPPPDGIPAIDEPKFETVSESDAWLDDLEPVISFQWGGEARAYPLQILIWHEIVNDEVSGKPITVTFCPLCNATIVFDREVDGAILDFGTSGNLRNSDLVMYDRQTKSWWQQFTGEGIVGEYTGARLMFLPAGIVSWADFKAEFPEGLTLSRDTGHPRNYGVNPYTGYDSINSRPFLYSGDIDGRLPAMARIAALELGESFVAYPFTVLEDVGVINDLQNDTKLAVFWKSGTVSSLDQASIAASRDVGSTAIFNRVVDGQLLTFSATDNGLFQDEETSSFWNIFGEAVEGSLAGSQLEQLISHEYFWFSWAAFRPETIIYSVS